MARRILRIRKQEPGTDVRRCRAKTEPETMPSLPQITRPESSALLTPANVAQITGLSVETLAQWRSQRQGIPFIKISRNVVRYRQSDLDAWLAERIVPVEKDQPRRLR